ncbi:MAG: DUF2723 domain-containing protein [Deltaproteobacteria bacterium]|nr:DUF2723 domain-containing protein [Deltaproteobacteria bacterium]
MAHTAAYLAGAAPVLFWRDAAEFSMIGFNLDIGHPAGSPAFAMAAKALSFLPLGSIAFRAVLVTQLFAGAAAALIAWIVWRVARTMDAPWPVPELAGLLASVSIGLSPAYFDWVAAPEVYSAQIAIVVFLLALAVRTDASAAADRRAVFLGTFAMGLGCGFHMGTVLLAPGLALIYLGAKNGKTHLRDIAVSGLFFAIGFAAFALLPVRSLTEPPFDQGNPETWTAFLAHVTGRRYSGIIHSFPWPRIVYNLRALAGHFPSQLTWPVALLAPVGLFAVAVKRPLAALGIAVAVAGHLYLYIKDWERAFGYLPLFALAAILAGVGAAALLRRPARGVAIRAAAVVAAVFAFQAHRAIADHALATDDLAHRHARGLLNASPHGALVVSFQDANSYTMFNLQSIERYREDVVHLHRTQLAAAGYLARKFPALDWDAFARDAESGLADALLRVARGRAVYWDYGWEEGGDVPPDRIEPEGFLYRVTPGPAWPDFRRSAEIFARYFAPVEKLSFEHPSDFTAREIYARRHLLDAKYRFDRGDKAGARAAVDRALRLRPDFGTIHARLAVLLAADGDLPGAYDAARRATLLEPVNPENWTARGDFARLTELEDDAVASYRAALALNRHQGRPAAALGALLLGRGEFKEARETAEEAMVAAARRGERVRLRGVIARALIGEGKFEEASGVLRAVLGEAPDDERSRELLDYCVKAAEAAGEDT